MKSVMIAIIILLLAPLAHFSDTYANDYFDSPYAKKIEANYKFVTDKNLSKVDLHPYFSMMKLKDWTSSAPLTFKGIVGVSHISDIQAIIYVAYEMRGNLIFKNFTFNRIDSGQWVVFGGDKLQNVDANFGVLFTNK